MFAMCCDYRIMSNDVPNAVIGLNEVALGISVPRYWVQMYVQQLGVLRAEQSLLTGRMLTPSEALAGGLLHSLVPKADLIPAAEKALGAYLKHPDAGRIITKQSARGEFAERWQAFCQQEAQGAWELLSSPPITAALGAVLAQLSGAPAAPKSKL